jgi:DNA segregation ATPase FtsK/SpoIIIE, S-DNA-T family
MVEDQADDLWGLAFLLLAVLAGLGIYAGVIGPAGHALRTGSADLFGLARYGLPPGFALLGGYLILRHARSEPGRVAVGLGLALMAASGLLCVLTGKDTLHQPVAAMGRAGGLLGAAEGVPLRAGLASWGAGLVFAAAGFVACLIITATPVRAVAARVRSVCTAAAHAARWSWYLCKDLARGGQRMASATRHPSVRGPGLLRRVTQPSRDVIDLAEPAEARAALPVTSHQPEWAPPDDGDEDEADDEGLHGAGLDEGGGTRGGALLEGALAGGRAAAAPPAQPVPTPIAITGLASRGPAAPGRAQQLDLGLPRETAPAWRLPPMALLRRSKHTEVDRRQIEVLGQTLESALAAHGVETRLVAATVGPSVTRYELELGPGVKVQKVTALQRDIAYALAAADVRILAPIPGKSAIGVEVPNRQRQTVTLGDILGSPEAAAARHPLEVAAGRDIAGRPVLINLGEMPHLLIAGATGSGKSSCINSMLTSLLMRATPDQVRLILIDPKRVELGHYTGLPHLLTAPVTNPKKAANALHWAVQEMERRYDLLAEVGMRDITGYNAAFDRGELAGEPEGGTLGLDDGLSEDAEAGSDGGPTAGPGAQDFQQAAAARYTRLPFIVVVVDELNDLMMVAARDVEESICRIAQMARAVGIHLVLATQRPSVDVITGLIKANIPSRLAFAVSSLADSRVVLDQPGAERLIGKGDMLLLTASSSQARRIQGPWADEEDIRKIVGHWRRQAGPAYVEGVDGPEGTSGGVGEDSDDDELLTAAMQLVVRSQLGSTSMLQRKLRVGFARAGRLMDLLEQRGVVGQSEGSKARAVLMTVDELEGP